MDFIVGLYGENRESFSKNFEILKKLEPDNITFHALAQKVGSKYFEENINGNESESIKIAKDIEIFTKENSYKPYYLFRQKNIIGNLENIISLRSIFFFIANIFQISYYVFLPKSLVLL